MENVQSLILSKVQVTTKKEAGEKRSCWRSKTGYFNISKRNKDGVLSMKDLDSISATWCHKKYIFFYY